MRWNLNRQFIAIACGLILLGAGCNVETTTSSNTQQTPPVSSVVAKNTPAPPVEMGCELPDVWGELGPIFKDCALKEVENGTGYLQTFHVEGANGLFDYCNTLTFRKYTTSAGEFYTFEKVRYQHFPNSEAGEYRMPKELYDSITNSRPCDKLSARFGNFGDDELSADLFPSRNILLSVELPGVNVLTTALSAAATPRVTAPSPSQTTTIPDSGTGCCKICSKGKACGNSCISRSYTCHQPPGCACDAY